MATLKAKKAKVMDVVRTILQDKKNIIVTDYRGINVEQMTALRSQLRKSGIKYKVLKNTISRKLLSEAGLSLSKDVLSGPVALGFLSKDIAASTKTILNYAKENELLKVKAGIIEGSPVSEKQLQAIASLPSREVLLGQLLGVMQAPVRNFMLAARGTAQNLVYALNAIKEKKEQSAA